MERNFCNFVKTEKWSGIFTPSILRKTNGGLFMTGLTSSFFFILADNGGGITGFS